MSSLSSPSASASFWFALFSALSMLRRVARALHQFSNALLEREALVVELLPR